MPSDEPLLEPWLRDDLEIVTFGPGGDVHFEGSSLKLRRRARRAADPATS